MARGFSLIELIIVLLIIGVLCNFALANYQQYRLKSQRVEASLALKNLALNLNHYFNLHHSYKGASLSKLHIAQFTQGGYYQLNIDQLTNTEFIISASPRLSQIQDIKCEKLILDSLGNETASGHSSQAEQDCW
ncbi:MAG: pilE [Gammaproteobacteria bacterium]|jgi:prepilin-type N-terminal cleavage/methylation domain-containing protein|nr:pilE [Gammaproteobacteria bacterium]